MMQASTIIGTEISAKAYRLSNRGGKYTHEIETEQYVT